MTHGFAGEFYLIDWDEIDGEDDEHLTDEDKYSRVIVWAGEARRRNPLVFDAVTEWIRDDSQWRDEDLATNERILMNGVIARFRAQNERLRTYLNALESTSIVNPPVFAALDRFADELSGASHDGRLRGTVERLFVDFSIMRDPAVRQMIAGEPTGPAGVDSVDFFGYINHLKSCDAEVQWTLFMPEMVKDQQKGFHVATFDFMTLPAMRFVGREDDHLDDADVRKELFAELDSLSEHASGLDYDVMFFHHEGLGVDVGPWHCLWGRFLSADAPVPEGFTSIDFLPGSNGEVGPPYVAQLAFATFSGDIDTMHQLEGYDVNAMYDVTRNILLGQGVMIPYPDKYWTAEVFLNGSDKSSTAYMFGVML